MTADEHDPKEAERILDTAAVPIRAIPISDSVRDRAVCGQISNQTKRLRLQILPCRVGIHSAVVPDSRVCQLQHLLGHREDIARHLPSPRPPQDLPCARIRIHPLTRSVYMEEHHWNTSCRCRDGTIFLLLHQ